MDETHDKHDKVPQTGKTDKPSGSWKDIKETIWTVLGAIFVVVAIRCFLFAPFNIPSGSMIPSLLIGDYIVVTTYDYGYSKYSLPFSKPDFEGRLWYTPPKRGDVVVFRSTKPPYDYYVKRVIGLPGDTIQVKDSVLYINGQAVPRTMKGDYEYQEKRYDTPQIETRYVESLPSAGKTVEHSILQDKVENGYYPFPTLPNGDLNVDNTVPYHVPAGHFFAMGDNRDHSADSRFTNRNSRDYLGYVPIDNLIGKARFVFYSYDSRHPVWQFWHWPTEIRWNRLLKAVK